MSLLKEIVGGFFYIVPDEELLRNYKPIFKKYSLLNIIIIALFLRSLQLIYPMSILFSKSNEIINFMINHYSKLDFGIFFSVDSLTLFSGLIVAPFVENFIFFKVLISVKNNNVYRTILTLSLIAVLYHLIGGELINSILSFFAFWMFMDIFLGAYKQKKNGYLLSVICHSLSNLLIFITYEFLRNILLFIKYPGIFH